MISEMPLLIFTCLTGVGAGAYALRPFFPAQSESARVWVVPLVCLCLVCAGSLMVTGHLARPERIVNVLNNPMSSLAMEGICSGVLIVGMLVDLMLVCKTQQHNKVVAIVGAVLACVLMMVQTGAYLESYGYQVWASASTIPFFVAGDLAAGAGLLAVCEVERDNGKRLLSVAGCFALVWAICCAWIAFTVNALFPEYTTLLWCGCGLAVVAAVVGFAYAQKNVAMLTWVYLLAVVVSLAVARYAFYAAV